MSVIQSRASSMADAIWLNARTYRQTSSVSVLPTDFDDRSDQYRRLIVPNIDRGAL